AFWKEFANVAKASAITAALALLFPLTSQAADSFGDPGIYYFLPVAIVACMTGRIAARACAQHLVRSFDAPRSLIIVGSGPRALSLYKQVQQSGHHRLEVLGFVDSPRRNHEVTDEMRHHLIGTLDVLDHKLMKLA